MKPKRDRQVHLNPESLARGIQGFIDMPRKTEMEAEFFDAFAAKQTKGVSMLIGIIDTSPDADSLAAHSCFFGFIVGLTIGAMEAKPIPNARARSKSQTDQSLDEWWKKNVKQKATPNPRKRRMQHGDH